MASAAPTSQPSPAPNVPLPLGITRLFDGRTLAGWKQIPADQWVVKDGALVSLGKGRGVIATEGQYSKYRIIFDIRHVSAEPKKDHPACVLFFCTNPPENEKPLDMLGVVQFMVPQGFHWDYRPGKGNSGNAFFTTITKSTADQRQWSRVELLVDAESGTARLAVAQPPGAPAVELGRFRDPTAGKKGPFAIQMHNGGLVDEYANIAIEENPKVDGLITVRSTGGAAGTTSKPSTAAPLMELLDRFTAPDVPALAPSETAVTKLTGKPQPDGLPGKGMAEHPMLVIGEGYNNILLVKDGKIIWTYQTGGGWEYDDVWMLSNGNILFSRMQYVAEVTPRKEVVWRYDAPAGTEIHACQPIGLDNVMFVQNGTPPKLFVMNIKTKSTEFQHDLDSNPSAGVHGQFRRARFTAQGTYLIPYLGMNKVVEYDKDWKVVWEYPVKSPWAAIRLKNGNTLITDEADKTTLEVNPAREIVWQLKPTDLPEGQRFNGSQSCTRLGNGNTIICSRGGKDFPQIVEVTGDKKVVWILKDYANVGPVTAVQILDDPGIPENPGESEH
jgi:hypothetical protein